MNKEYSSQAILLNHKSSKEADKILFFITPLYGKVIVQARAIKKLKSKLSGGIGQFNLSHIEYIEWKDNFFMLTASSSLRHYNISDLSTLNSCFEIMAILLKTVAQNQESSSIFFAYILSLEQFQAYPNEHKHIKNIFLMRLFYYLSLLGVNSLGQELGRFLSLQDWEEVQDFYRLILREKDIYKIPHNIFDSIDKIVKFILESEVGFTSLKKI